MQRRLDRLRFKENRYERPNQEWVCGRAAEGHGCRLGPDARGHCRATGECNPAKKGDRWFCTRVDAQGGKCAEGPLPSGGCAHPIAPCQPVPSLRRARGSLVWLIVALTTGTLLILFGSPSRERWLDPGPLTNAHATSAGRCADCHTVGVVAHAAIANSAPAQKKRLTESALCLKCHALGDHPFDPHGIAPAALALKSKTDRAAAKDRPMLLRVSKTLSGSRAHSGNLACMTCHQEHRGRNFDLKHLSDAQCQTCHSAQFASFGDGHPEFSGYPYRSRTRIFFDHASHLQTHFSEAKEKAPKSCQDCHVTDSAGRFMQVKNFATTCAACHEPQIQGAGMSVKGTPFFTVPGIDAETLAAKGISIGEWPKLADGKITPFMEMLLRPQPAMLDALGKLRGVDLNDLGKANPEQLAAAEQLAWGVKQLLFHLVVDGQSYLSKEFQGAIAPAGIAIPRAALLAAQGSWMPHLLAEVSSYQNGIKPPLPDRPKPTPTPPQAPAAAATKAAPTGNDDILTADDLAAAPPPKPGAPPPQPSPAKPASDEITIADLLADGAAETPEPSATPAANTPAKPKPADEWVAAGGWYQPEDSFTLYYRPAGHADPFLVAWLTTAARVRQSGAGAEKSDPFARLTEPQAPGVCMKCHTTDERNGVMAINWSPAQPQAANRKLTTFSHNTHLSVIGDAGCQTCHALNPKSEYATFFARDSGTESGHDPTKFQSNFAPISKFLCAQCHQPRVAGDACILCHRYHTRAATATLADAASLQEPSIKK